MVQKIFNFENPTLVQTLATIDASEIQQCFCLRNDMYKDHAYCCYCQKWQVTLELGFFFTNF